MDIFSGMEDTQFPFDNHSGIPPIDSATYADFIGDFEAIISESKHML